ncbi:hypothetical protein J6590_009594 [Homalodisca vitripennis]|nr:hypothetical protein J6590_009594 [Homalodisca vitripennis]
MNKHAKKKSNKPLRLPLTSYHVLAWSGEEGDASAQSLANHCSYWLSFSNEVHTRSLTSVGSLENSSASNKPL